MRTPCSPVLRAAAGIVLLFSGTALAQMPGGPPPPVTVAKPIVKDVVEQDSFTGRYEAVDFVEVRARVTGFIDSVQFRDGTFVNKGDPLFMIDRRPYKATLDQAEAAVVSSQARLSFAESDLTRAEQLRQSGNITDQLLDQRRQNFLTAKADFDRAEAAVREARLNYEFTEVRAPIAGRIGRKLISEGNLVTANQTLLTTIVSLDPVYFTFDIDERAYLAYQKLAREAGRQRGGMAATEVLLSVTGEAQPTRKGTLDFIDNRIDPASGTIRARATVPNPDLFVTPGVFGTIAVPGSPSYKGVLVPDEAIATDQERRLVWAVAPDGSVSAKVVRPGPRIDGYRLIREGLTGDETIVVNGLQRVRPGAKVTPTMTELPPKRG